MIMMVFSFYSLVWMLGFLALGVICLAVFQRFVYPALSARYERAKVTATQKRDPARVTRIVYLLSLLVFPLLGFLLGSLYG
jgi:cytochrome b561